MSSIYYKKGYKYQLTRDYTHKLHFVCPNVVTAQIQTDGDTLTIKAGYAWDGPSGPTLDTKTAMRSSLVHDALYQLMREEEIDRGYQDDADAELEIISLEDGMWSFRAKWWERGLRIFGGRNTHPDNKKRELVAP